MTFQSAEYDACHDEKSWSTQPNATQEKQQWTLYLGSKSLEQHTTIEAARNVRGCIQTRRTMRDSLPVM